MISRWIFSELILATMTIAMSAAAVERKALPAFHVIAASGTEVASDRLNTSERWLLIYVTPGSVACERLLRALDGWSLSQLSDRAVVVVGGSRASIEANVRPLLGASGTTPIYADSDGTAVRALALTDAPALLGIEGGQVDWTVQGVLNDPEMLKSLVQSWLGR